MITNTEPDDFVYFIYLFNFSTLVVITVLAEK